MTNNDKATRTKWRIFALVFLAIGVLSSAVTILVVPYIVENSVEKVCKKNLQEIAILMDSTVTQVTKAGVDTAIIDKVEEVFATRQCALSEAIVLTVMEKDVPIFSIRQGKVEDFVSPQGKQYVYSYISSKTGYNYIVTIPREKLSGEILRLTWQIILAIGAVAGLCAILCLRIAGRNKKNEEKKA